MTTHRFRARLTVALAGFVSFATGVLTTPSAAQEADVSLLLLVIGLDQPLGLAAPDDGSGRLFVVERRGAVRLLSEDSLDPDPFLDLRGRVGTAGSEQGLLGLAFDPSFDFNEYLYVHYTRAGDGAVVISRFRVSATDANRVDSGSERVLLVVRQPTPFHNGGQLAFGPDGYLYVSLGDGGGVDRMRAQNLGSLHGSILRLDVHPANPASPYSIPSDNPFVGVAGARPEIWAYGLRNPWRFSFDRLTGDLWIADVGEGTWEEVNRQPAASPGGENYGWPVMEGVACFGGLTECDPLGPWTWPVSFYLNNYQDNGNCAVTGGHVYRGDAIPSLQGAYVFGDFCSGRIWAGRPGFTRLLDFRLIVDLKGTISSFGEDASGRLYLLEFGSGRLWRIIPTPTEATLAPDLGISPRSPLAVAVERGGLCGASQTRRHR